jgi:PAS domain S-box-containing protein
MGQESTRKKFSPDPELFNSIIEVSSEITWVRNLKTEKILWLASKANLEKFNLPQDNSEIFWRENIHPKDKEKTSKKFYENLADPTMSAYTREFRFRAANNEWRNIRDKIGIIRNAKGKATRVFGVWEDITEAVQKERKRKELLRDLEKDKNRFKIISELSNAVMWEENIKTGKLYWTADTKTLVEFGLTKENFTVDDWVNHVHPDDYSRSATRFKKALHSSDGIYNDEYRIVKPDGSIAHIVDRGMIICDKENNPIRAIGGWVDVTKERIHEQKIAGALAEQLNLNQQLAKREEELATSEEELREVNVVLLSNNKKLVERDQTISRLQSLAKIGNWVYDPIERKFSFSDEIYQIHEVDSTYAIENPDVILQYYDSASRILVFDLIEKANAGKLDPFDIVLKIQTPLGYQKWARVCGWLAEGNPPQVFGLTYDITYSKEAEARLKSSEHKFSSTFHGSPDLMILMQRDDWVIVDINEKVFPLLNYTREELLGSTAKNFSFFAHQHEREYFFSQFDATNSVEMEAELKRKNGTTIHALLSFSTLEFEDKRHILALIKDISSRKAAEERFIKAFDLSPDLMLIFRELDLILIECNRNVELLSGYKREEIIRESSVDFNLWAIDADREAFNEQYFVKGNAVFMESEFLRKDGTTFKGNISAKRISLQGENHMLVIVRDITERKIAEQKVLESEANLYAVINNTNLIVWSVDLEFRIIKSNKPFNEYVKTRYKTDVTLGERMIPADVKLAELLKSTWVPRYKRVLNGEKYQIVETYDGRSVEFSLGPIMDGSQIIGIVVFANDITEKVKQEQDLKNALNKVVEFKLMALRSVMNPHFFFNALSSIQYFIAQNDRKNAINYLSTFSKLVRGILEHSVSNTIKLSEEIEQLENYIALERLRFEEKFDCYFEIDERLDLKGTEIPSLLIQPYVENAIIHGLYNKKDSGTLKILIQKENDAILFVVLDNGIGREAAKQFRDKNMVGRKSLGTAITEERLNLINNQYKVAIEVIDIYDENKMPEGTCVKIWLKN